MTIYRAIYDINDDGNYRHFPLESDNKQSAKDKASSMLADIGIYIEASDIDIVDILEKDWRVKQ